MIKTIKDLKKAIQDLPDDMLVMGHGGNEYSTNVSYWIISKDTLSEEEIEDGYPDGVKPTLMITFD